MKQAELATLMEECSVDAVRTAEQEFDVTLDFSKESVSKVDDILLSFLDKYQDRALEDSAVFTICNIYGAYLGECYRKLAGGHWRYEDTDPEAPFVVLDVADRSYAFAGICYERLVNNSNISAALYFEQALGQQVQ